MRSLYEGPFGDQPQVWKLEERVVKLEKGARGGGKGDVLNAGFERGEQVPNEIRRPSLFVAGGGGGGGSGRSALSQSPPPGPRRRRTSNSSNNGIEYVMDGDEDDRSGGEERATKRMRKRSQVGAFAKSSDAFWEDDEIDEEGRRRGQELEDGDYEILLTGSVSQFLTLYQSELEN